MSPPNFEKKASSSNNPPKSKIPPFKVTKRASNPKKPRVPKQPQKRNLPSVPQNTSSNLTLSQFPTPSASDMSPHPPQQTHAADHGSHFESEPELLNTPNHQEQDLPQVFYNYAHPQNYTGNHDFDDRRPINIEENLDIPLQDTLQPGVKKTKGRRTSSTLALSSSPFATFFEKTKTDFLGITVHSIYPETGRPGDIGIMLSCFNTELLPLMYADASTILLSGPRLRMSIHLIAGLVYIVGCAITVVFRQMVLCALNALLGRFWKDLIEERSTICP